MDYFMYIASYEYAFAHFQKKNKICSTEKCSSITVKKVS